jgi:hypothetical protein
MVLFSHQGYSPQEIASITRQSDETVRRWLHPAGWGWICVVDVQRGVRK